MHYSLHQLKIFLKVHDCESITKAAQELHLTQPAVSIQLKRLQEQFELPLTEVVGRKLFITSFGKEIAIKCRRILLESEEIKYMINQHKGLLTGKISISVVSTAKYVIPYFLKPFMDKYPGIDISIDVSNKTKVVEGLHNNKSDFSLVSVLPSNLDIETVELLENRLYLVGSKEYEGRLQKADDLGDFTLIFREEGSATRSAMENFLRKNNIISKKAMTLVSNEAIKQAIIAGIGFSIVPLIGLRTALEHENIMIYPISGLPVITNWNLVYHRSKNLTPAQQALIEFIETNKKEITQKNFDWAISRKL